MSGADDRGGSWQPVCPKRPPAACGATRSSLHLLTIIGFFAQHLLEPPLFGEMNRLHMLGIFQHLVRQAGLPTIAFHFSHGLSVPGNSLLAFRHLVHDARELLQKLFTVDGHQRVP
jgi:hypothetical protein